MTTPLENADPVQISSVLMQNYISASSEHDAVEPQAVEVGGAIDLLFTRNDTARSLFYTAHDDAAHAGWTQQALDGFGIPRADGLENGKRLLVRIAASTIYYSAAPAGASFPPCRSAGDHFVGDCVDFGLRMFHTGDAMVLGVSSEGRVGYAMYSASADTFGPWKELPASMTPASPIVSVRDDNGVMFFYSDVAGRVHIAIAASIHDPVVPWVLTTSGPSLELRLTLPTVTMLGNVVVLVAYEPNARRTYSLCRDSRGTWDRSWAELAPLPSAPQQMIVLPNASDLIDVYALLPDHHLWVFHQTAQGTTELSTPIPIAERVGGFTGARRADGSAVMFVSTEGTKRLLECAQQPDTTDWMVKPVGRENDHYVNEVRSYATELVMRDPGGAPRPKAHVKLWAAGFTVALVNGTGTVLTPETAVEVQADLLGRVSLTWLANGLGAPTYRVWHDGMSSSDAVELQANSAVQDELEVVTADDLLAATVADGSLLLQGEARDPEIAAAVAEGVNRCMSLARVAEDAPSSGARPMQAFVPQSAAFRLNRIDPGKVAEQHWVFRGGARPAFQHLSRKDADARLAAARASSSVDAVWGDIVQAFHTGGALLEEIFVTTVVDPMTQLVTHIESAVTYLMDGVEYLYVSSIELVQQAFDLVEGIFSEVQVGFQDLFEWLGFLFDWEDILRTKESISWTLDQTLQFVARCVAALEAKVVEEVEGVRDTVVGYLDTVKSSPQADKTLAELMGIGQERAGDRGQVLTRVNTHNVVLDGLLDNLEDVVVAAANPAGLTEETQALLEQVNSSSLENVGAFQASEAFATVQGFILQFQEDPTGLLTTPFSEFIAAIEGLIGLGVDYFLDVVHGLFGAVVELIENFLRVLAAEWEVPLVSVLYAQITQGDALSALNLFSLALAVPSTVVYKAMYGAAPFPDDAALEAFKATCNVDTLPEFGDAVAEADPRADDPDAYPPYAAVLQVIHGCALVVDVVLDAVTDWQMIGLQEIPPVEAAPLLAGSGEGEVAPAFLASELAALKTLLSCVVYASSCPWWVSPQSSGNAPSTANVLWVVKGAVPVLDVATVVANGRLLKQQFQWGPWAQTAVGGFALSIALTMHGFRRFDTPWTAAEDCLMCVPMCFKWLGYGPYVVDSKGVTTVFLFAIDASFGLTAIATSFAQAYDIHASRPA